MRPDLEVYVTGIGQHLQVHAKNACHSVDWCIIHDPRPGAWRDWPTAWREDRRIMERICPHGVGHPAVEQAGSTDHGCDGCPCQIITIEGEVL